MFKKWLSRLNAPTLKWIQIEVSSFCNAECIYCPRTVLKKSWDNRHFPMDLYKKLLPVFPKTGLIFLQGWGEPFLNPDLFEMIFLAKKAGCRVGTTTNGTLLDNDTIRRLIASELDILCISMAGTDRETNDQIRKGTSLDALLETLKKIKTIKKTNNSRYPAIHVAYLLMKSGLNDVNQLPEILQRTGVSEVVISTLDFIPDPALAAEAIRPSAAKEYDSLCHQLERVKKRGADEGIRIHYQIVNPAAHYLTCTENILKTAFISSDGGVSPCVFTNLPLKPDTHPAPMFVEKYHRIVFGNIADDPVPQIWRRKTYSKFRKSFLQANPPAICTTCPKLLIG